MRPSVRLPRALAVACLLAGCAVGPDYHQPQLDLPDRFLQAQPPPPKPAEAPAGQPAAKDGEAAAPPAVDVPTWWHALHDPELDSLVERALKGNPSLDIALARLQQARTFEVLVTGLALPRVIAAAGGGKGTGSDLTRNGRVPTGLGSADHSVSSSSRIDMVAGFDAAWEIDLFGRLRRQIEAAHYDAQAAASARDAVQVTVIADVARAYLDLRGLQMQLAVQLQSVRAAQDLLDVVQARFDRGIINELDVTLARRQLATAQSQVAPLQAQISATQQVIAVLLGLFPQDLDAELSAPSLIPPMPDRIGPGIPLDLIRRRPDIREAEWQLAGATARIGVATGLLFPQIVLTGGLGEQGIGSGFSPASTQRIWSAGYSAVLPLLDFGALDAQVKIADLQTRERLTRYKETIQAAVQDVDTALASYAAQQSRLLSLGEAVIASQRATELATQRYDRGLTDFLNVIDAQRQEYDLEGQYAAAQTSVADQFVSVYRGLGGGWEQFQEPPVARPLPAVAAMFQHLFTSGYPQQ